MASLSCTSSTTTWVREERMESPPIRLGRVKDCRVNRENED